MLGWMVAATAHPRLGVCSFLLDGYWNGELEELENNL